MRRVGATGTATTGGCYWLGQKKILGQKKNWLYLWGSGKPSPQPRVSERIICDHQNHDADHHHDKTNDKVMRG